MNADKKEFSEEIAENIISRQFPAQNSVITPEIEFLVMKLHFSESLYVIWPYIFLAIAFLITQIRVNSRQICEQKLYRTKWGRCYAFGCCFVVNAVFFGDERVYILEFLDEIIIDYFWKEHK